jgi:hypothetical protein
MTRKQVLQKALRGEIKWTEAAEILRISGRQMRRIKTRFINTGTDALYDLRLGSISKRRTKPEVREMILKLFRDQYRDFSASHFFEKLKTEHRFEGHSYSTVLRVLQQEGLVGKAERKPAHRTKRRRRPIRGMMVHMDGSTHDWFNTGQKCDLVAALDDADSKVLAAKFVNQEGSRTCMQVLLQAVKKFGVFSALYTDRAMHFVITKKGGKKPDRTAKSQIERALDKLGTELIFAYSPQARGRMERMWRTWQGRLPQELRLKGIQTIEDGNLFLEKYFIPWHNRNLTVIPEDPESSAFIKVPSSTDLELIFSTQYKRQVNFDHTIQFKNRSLQIPRHKELKANFAGLQVTVHEHLDHTISITYGNHVLAKYDQNFNLNLNYSHEKPMREAA